MSIGILLELTVKPELLAHVEKRLAENLPATREWNGCLGLDVYRDADDPCKIVFVERWVSRAHYEEYDTWRVETGAFAEFTGYCTKPLARRYLNLTTI